MKQKGKKKDEGPTTTKKLRQRACAEENSNTHASATNEEHKGHAIATTEEH
jgi:hypothetical protein